MSAKNTTTSLQVPEGVYVRGDIRSGFECVLTENALLFLAKLHRHFEERRQGILRFREKRQAELDAGVVPTFLEHTQWIRESEWKGASIPHDLQDRRVEITGPVDRKMVINALNSGAKVYMADFEDSSAPTWLNMVDGQINLRDAVNRTISFSGAEGKQYKLKSDKQLATLMVRPRGWHLDEPHVLVDGQAMSGSLFDFGLFFFHNAKNLIRRKSGPYFYLPKMESHIEARLWNDVFVYAQEYVGIPRGTIRATVLLETIMAAFEIDEILFELREHSAGMNCGRWDYIFSFIKKFRTNPSLVLPDRGEVTMTKPFMSSYVQLVIQTCHKRGVHAMGGMAAQIPVKNNPAANNAAVEKVKADKLREVKAGHDGTWVAHPDLIPLAMTIFDEHMKTPNQIHVKREDVKVSSNDLVFIGQGGSVTEKGMRDNIYVGLTYLEAWLRGNGCVPINNLMEDAATAEISRSQVWQWIKHGAKMKMENGSTEKVTKALVQRVLKEELDKIKNTLGDKAFNDRPWKLTGTIFADLMLSDTLADFMTSAAYPHITKYAPVKITARL